MSDGSMVGWPYLSAKAKKLEDDLYEISQMYADGEIEQDTKDRWLRSAFEEAPKEIGMFYQDRNAKTKEHWLEYAAESEDVIPYVDSQFKNDFTYNFNPFWGAENKTTVSKGKYSPSVYGQVHNASRPWKRNLVMAGAAPSSVVMHEGAHVTTSNLPWTFEDLDSDPTFPRRVSYVDDNYYLDQNSENYKFRMKQIEDSIKEYPDNELFLDNKPPLSDELTTRGLDYIRGVLTGDKGLQYDSEHWVHSGYTEPVNKTTVNGGNTLLHIGLDRVHTYYKDEAIDEKYIDYDEVMDTLDGRDSVELLVKDEDKPEKVKEILKILPVVKRTEWTEDGRIFWVKDYDVPEINETGFEPTIK